MFRNKPASPALGAALQQGGSAPQTQTPFSAPQAQAPQSPFGNMAQAASHQMQQGNSQFGPAMHQFAESRNSSPLNQLAGRFPNTGVSGAMPGGVGVPPVAQAAPAAAAAPTYAPIAGFDFDKLRGAKAYDSAAKYSDAVRAFSKGLGSGVQVSRNNLGGMVDYAKANGFGNATAVGDDKIDFGDGNGPIDVVRSNGELWFQNGPDRFGGVGSPAPHAVGPTMSVGNMDASQIAALGQQPGQNLDAAGSASMLQQILSKLQNPQQQALSQALRTY